MSARRRRGFTLVEVLVSTVILELGVLAALSIVTLATRALTSAVLLETALAAGTTVADSLAASLVIRDGTATLGGHGVRWSAAPEGWLVRVEVVAGDSLELVGGPEPTAR